MDASLEPEALDRLMAELRPRLHRYCARMVGSAFEGEDVVQEALAKAAEALPDAGPIERPESWLFRIAHNAALDALRRRKRQPPLQFQVDLAGFADATESADSRVAATASLAAFLRLPPSQRSSVVDGSGSPPALRCLVVTCARGDPMGAARCFLQLPEGRLGLQPVDQELTAFQGCLAM